MALPELLANSPTPGTREAYTDLEAELKTGETSMKWSLAPPTSCRGTGTAGIGGQFRVVIGSEIILCEAGESKTVVILERKAEGSIEANHANTTPVWIVPTAEGVKLTSGSLIEVITSTRKWKKPKGASQVTAIVIGGGGGGGSGSETAEKVAGSGGGGGGGACVNIFTFPASVLAAEEECTVGKGGAGGKFKEIEGEGEAGKEGEPSHFGELLYAAGGAGGGAGKAASGGTGGETKRGTWRGNVGGAGGHEAAGKAPTVEFSGAGGGGGGGGPSTTVFEKGGAGGFSFFGSEVAAEGGATAGAEGKEGAEGLAESGLPGHGGGGGAAGFDAAAGKGGKGGKYGGGGGGGGGASLIGKKTGEGGAGGEGVIVITTEF